jgi:hypothetical protein
MEPDDKGDLPKLADQVSENQKLIDQLWSQNNDWSQFFATPIGKAFAGLLIAMLMGATAWITDKSKAVPVAPVNPVNVVVHPVDPNVSPIVPPAAKPTIKLYLTTAVKDTFTDIPGVTVDPKIYEVGSAYPWNGKSIPLPCYAVIGTAGVQDVQPYTSKDDLIAAIKKGGG